MEKSLLKVYKHNEGIMTNPKNDPKLTLNLAFTELEQIVSQFEHDEVDLEQSMPKFKRGLELAKFLKSRLNKLENEIKTVKAEFNDNDDVAGIDIEESELE